ncbi:MAG: MltA domain-containing protein [Pseudomonadota bacterium]|nr:MltA domain-containing protein [Pseudomonadota bacterium]
MKKVLQRWLPAAILGGLAACSSPLPVDDHGNGTAQAHGPTVPMVRPTLVRARARWIPVDWSDLQGWEADKASDFWAAFLRGCERPAFDWAALCEQARAEATAVFSDDAARAWLRQRLQPYRVESMTGSADGLLTGYFEPQVEATRAQRPNSRVPLYGLPGDLATRKPYWTRQQIDTLPAAKASLRNHVLAYVSDPLDALILQIQGSGRLVITEADGRRRWVRIGFAGHNDQPYKSVGRWLIEQGELTPEQASWPAIKAWAKSHPRRLNELLWANPRVVFFREEPLTDPQAGPRGGLGAALTPGRSVAVDLLSIPYGTPLWLDSSEPLSSTPLRRLVVAQDTGTAIVGAVRADYFWGVGEDAENAAGRTKQPLRLWVLWPKGG